MQSTSRLETIQKNTAKIMRALRKERGFSQADMGNLLGFTQSEISRFEAGKRTISILDWIVYCDKMEISADSAKVGYYEKPGQAKLLDLSDPNPFKLPKKYLRDRGSKVRSSRIFMNFFTLSSGETTVQNFLESEKVDPDFFMNLDNQINAGFPIGVFSKMVREHKIHKNNVHCLAEAVSLPVTHGQIQFQYNYLKKKPSLLRALIKNIKFYDSNFDYQITDQQEESIDVSVAPSAHTVGILKKNADINDALCQYFRNIFTRFSTYGGSTPMQVEEKECLYRGGEKCVYHLHS